MRVLETGDWSLLLPDEWLAEQDDEVILIGDRDEVGCIEISELRKDAGCFTDTDLAQFTDAQNAWTAVQQGSFRGLKTAFEEDGMALREWCIYAGDVLLYITYSCTADNGGMDDAAVDEILDTLRYAVD